MHKVNALMVLRCTACRYGEKKCKKKISRSKVCHLILSNVYCVIFLIQLTDFACQKLIGKNMDGENKTKKRLHFSG